MTFPQNEDPSGGSLKKAVSGGLAALGANVMAASTQTEAFWPHTATQWMAFLGSAAACVYTCHMLFDWWWKRFREWDRKKGGAPVANPFRESEL